jgi:ABC-2 type transport system ATP-binding protein
MSTHILSDAEALCDEVAILRRGRLAAACKLHDLLSESDKKEFFEIVVTNADAEKLIQSLNGNVEVKQRSADTLMIVDGEEYIEVALRVAHDAGGKLISVNPIRRSLEDLFVAQTKES